MTEDFLCDFDDFFATKGSFKMLLLQENKLIEARISRKAFFITEFIL